MPRADKRQRTVMRSATALTVVASRGNTAPIFTVQPSGSVSFTQGIPGSHDVSFTAVDPNSDPITYALVGTPPAGVSYQFLTGLVRFSYTSGGTLGSSNLRISADDGHGNVTQSSQFAVSLVEAYGWAQSFSGTQQIQKGGTFPLTNVYVEAPGEVPAWGIVSGQQALFDAGITLVNGVLVHDNRANVGATVPNVQFTSSVVAAGALISAGVAVIEYAGVKVNFGKHWSWAGPHPTDGKWYDFSGDGGTTVSSHDGGDSGNARWIRYDPDTDLLDYYYPFNGYSGQVMPCRPDSYMWILRANGNFVGLPGYQSAAPTPGDIASGVITAGGNGTLGTGIMGRHDYVPGPGMTPGTWTWTPTGWPVSMSENASNKNYDPVTDRAFAMRTDNVFMIWNLGPNTLEQYGVPMFHDMASTGTQQQVYVPETNELWALGVHGIGDLYTDNLCVIAVNVNTRTYRDVWQWDRPPQQSIASGVASMTPVIYIPSRRKLYIFIREYLDSPYQWQGIPAQPWTAANTGGIIEVSFTDASHTTNTWQVIPYSAEAKARALLVPRDGGANLGDVAINNAFYDPTRDMIFATFAGDTAVLKWTWAP